MQDKCNYTFFDANLKVTLRTNLGFVIYCIRTSELPSPPANHESNQYNRFLSSFNAQHSFTLTLNLGPSWCSSAAHSFSICRRVAYNYDGLDYGSLCLRTAIVLQMLWM